MEENIMKRLLVSCVVAVFTFALVSAGAQEKPAPPKSVDKQAKVLSATGAVAAITADSVTIKAASGEMTFSIDGKTNITGKGLSTKASALKKDGKPTTVTEFVHVGDGVAVKYHDMKGTNHAESIRIVNPAVKK
jgi:hypothetical protein